jgi:hypothetical protein
METVGIIIFSCLMSCVALFLIVNRMKERKKEKTFMVFVSIDRIRSKIG